MIIEFQYFKGCPHARQTLNHLKGLILDGIISENDLTITLVSSRDDAEKIDFQGSPTVLVNGIDIYTREKQTGFSYA